MNAASAYRQLVSIGVPAVETRVAQAKLGVTPDAADKLLRQLRDAELILPLRRGLWLIDTQASNLVLAPYLTAPYPGYVSLWSALAHHDMIEQIPARTEVASLGRSRTIQTPVGVFAIHRLARRYSAATPTSRAGTWPPRRRHCSTSSTRTRRAAAECGRRS